MYHSCGPGPSASMAFYFARSLVHEGLMQKQKLRLRNILYVNDFA
jgi:hypothetical protein